MKKILVFMLCLMLVCAMPLAAFAEEAEVGAVTTGEVLGDISTPEHGALVSTEVLPPEETLPVEEALSEETLPTETPDVDMEGFKDQMEVEFETLTENIKIWFEENSALVGLIVTVISYGLVILRKLGTVVKSASTMNNNAIAIAKNSENAIGQALSSIENASGTVTNHDASISALLEAYKTTSEDKARLETELVEIKNYLKTASKSNLEFADELAELLALANIPNYKKEEIGARHVAAKREIIDAEAKAEAAAVTPTTTEEVKEDVGEEA